MLDKMRGRIRTRRAKRGVSPIIATILLVAITVVLAAVLYVLISGLTSSGASTPYSLGMSEKSATTTGGNWITIQVNPTSGLTTGLFGLKVTSNVNSSTVSASYPAANATCKAGVSYAAGASGCGAPTTKYSWYAVLVNSGGSILSVFTSTGASTTGWTATAAVSGSDTLYIVSGAVLSGSIGFVMNAYPTSSSSVSGTVTL
jgi:flagellin-like protein